MPKFESTLHFSKFFMVSQCILLIGSVIAIYIALIPFYIKLLITLILCLFRVRSFRHQLEWQSIIHDKEGWYLQKNGQKYEIQILGDSTVTSLVSILRFKQQGKYLKQSITLFKDAMTENHYRQLIVRIKYF